LPAPSTRPARLTQHCYVDDAEVTGRAPATGASWVSLRGPDRDGGRLTPSPPLELPAPAPVEAQAAQPEHERGGDDPAGDTGAASAAGEEPAVTAAWYGGLPTGDGPDVDR
jgi:hypothetical protein